MSFYPQPYSYQCGPFALKYALVMYGKIEHENKIEEYAGTTWWYGTDEIGLTRAAKHFKCDLVEFNITNNAKKALTQLKQFLRHKHPVIICVENWSHWITVLTYKKNSFVCVDSALNKVITIISENELLERWSYEEDDEVYFSGYAVVPKEKPKILATFSLNTAKKLTSDNYQDLAYRWDYYFTNLLSMTRIKEKQNQRIISFKKFLSRYQNTIIDNLRKTNNFKKSDITALLNNFEFVANVYNLGVPISEINSTLIVLSSFITRHLFSY